MQKRSSRINFNKKLVKGLFNRLTILPRWVIIIIDLFIISVATYLGYVLRFNLNFEEVNSFHPVRGILLGGLAGITASLISKSYAGVIRYTGIADGVRILYTTLLSLLLSCVFNLVYYYNWGKNLVPYSVLVIGFFVSFLFLFYYRLIVKSIFTYFKSDQSEKKSVAIFGAGQSGILTQQIIQSDPRSKLRVVAFFEDDLKMIGSQIHGTRIYSIHDHFDELVEELSIKELIISVRNLSVERKNEIVDLCLRHSLKARTIPPVEKWVKGELSLGQIQEINIEDLLGREIIKLEDEKLYNELSGKRICITGAAGSIGSEIVRQVLLYKPSQLILIDQAESPLYELERQLFANHEIKSTLYVADISNRERINQIFRESSPEIVFHAAAYKHVPLMESNPHEAISCNILGTKILADLSVLHKVKKFVMISTDKAVNPASVMGCSKRIAEIYVQSLNQELASKSILHTVFVTTRFGNVLGSNGSVIPIFKKQIQSGGPVTVTHPDIRRYFMTIPEACRLVLEAGIMGEGGEIFIFDMGNPIKIYDLAVRMIRLSGLEPNKDIEIIYTGLRQGEKLFEELLNDQENTVPTHHDKILKAKVREYSYDEINKLIDLLQDLMTDKNELKMVALMKEMVPEFKSNYSRFEVLDESV